MRERPFDWASLDGQRQLSSSGERNRGPILEVLRRVLPQSAEVLEIASGTGTHAAWFVEHLPGLRWQPTDPDPVALSSIQGWRRHLREPRLLDPMLLDVTEPWPSVPADAVFCANMIHIAPWEAALGLFAGAGRCLGPGGLLLLYGPFHDNGPTSEGNAAFDLRLRARDPRWGVREQAEVAQAAAEHGLALAEAVSMPANNRTLVFRKG